MLDNENGHGKIMECEKMPWNFTILPLNFE